MKKPNEKQIKKYLLNVDEHFQDLIDAIVYYDSNEMDDWATDILGAIDEKSLVETFELLLSDLKNRKKVILMLIFIILFGWHSLMSKTKKLQTCLFMKLKKRKIKIFNGF